MGGRVLEVGWEDRFEDGLAELCRRMIRRRRIIASS